MTDPKENAPSATWSRIQPVILAGGSGTRLWPLSRQQYPKQFLALTGDDSLLQQTAARLPHQLVGRGPLVVGNHEHRFIVADQLRQADAAPRAILLEPAGRNTAAAIAAATSWLGQEDAGAAADDDPVLVVMPADHVITGLDAFRHAIRQAADLAEAGWLVTLGVQPTHAETGFGYIERGHSLDEAADSYAIAAFKEKPDPETARHYAASGRHAWNAGLFVGRQSVLAAELSHWAPDIHAAGAGAVAQASNDLDFVRLAEAPFEAAEAQPFDRAVMEHTTRGAVVDLPVQWSDLGTWESVWTVSERDSNGNALSGDVYAHATRNSYLRAESRLLATLGIDGLTVVETADAVFVAHRQRSQEVQQIVKGLQGQGRGEADTTVRQFRPWGYFETLDDGERFHVKRLVVHPGCQLSAQRHYHRAEHWVVVKGTARVHQEDRVLLLSENESTFIPLGVVHRLENPGKIDLEIVEVQSGSYLGEDDIERIADTYNRDTS